MNPVSQTKSQPLPLLILACISAIILFKLKGRLFRYRLSSHCKLGAKICRSLPLTRKMSRERRMGGGGKDDTTSTFVKWFNVVKSERSTDTTTLSNVFLLYTRVENCADVQMRLATRWIWRMRLTNIKVLATKARDTHHSFHMAALVGST